MPPYLGRRRRIRIRTKGPRGVRTRRAMGAEHKGAVARRKLVVGLVAILTIGLWISSVNAGYAPQIVQSAGAAAIGIHKIKHGVVMMQENRSFDNYFGTYPGGDGIPMKKGVPTVCNPDPIHPA